MLEVLEIIVTTLAALFLFALTFGTLTFLLAFFLTTRK